MRVKGSGSGTKVACDNRINFADAVCLIKLNGTGFHNAILRQSIAKMRSQTRDESNDSVTESKTSRVLNEFIDEVFQKFLATADVRGRFALLEHVGFEFLQRSFAGFNFCADAGIPRGVAVFRKLRQTAILANGGGNFQSTREGVHAADVRVK